tara:strand:+ start:374 stop:541 length:168 start_codon:yes stop_codon:yes gene_type:complete
MQISKSQHQEFIDLIDDTLEYFCDQENLSGELVWTILQCRSTAKLAEMHGQLAAT